jgi:hypothetical protein
MTSAAVISARNSRPTSTRFLYRLIIPTAVAAYSSFSRQGYLNRQYTRSYHVSTSNRAVVPFPSSGSYVAQHHDLVRTVVPNRVKYTSLKSTNSNREVNAKTLSAADIQHMKLASRLAGIGKGNTYPNPAVGCVLVRHQDEDEIIGSGFHPRYMSLNIEAYVLLLDDSTLD